MVSNGRHSVGSWTRNKDKCFEVRITAMARLYPSSGIGASSTFSKRIAVRSGRTLITNESEAA
jgi:hypothetical protein